MKVSAISISSDWEGNLTQGNATFRGSEGEFVQLPLDKTQIEAIRMLVQSMVPDLFAKVHSALHEGQAKMLAFENGKVK